MASADRPATIPGSSDSAESIGAEVAQLLSEAQAAAAQVLTDADHRASRVGREDLAQLRETLRDRIEALRDVRSRLATLGQEAVPRMFQAAEEVAEVPSRLASLTRDGAGGGFMDGVEDQGGGLASYLGALIDATDKIAENLVEAARTQARQLEEAARREAEQIASTEPKRLAQAYAPAIRNAEVVRRELKALNSLLGADEGPTAEAQATERREGWNRTQ